MHGRPIFFRINGYYNTHLWLWLWLNSNWFIQHNKHASTGDTTSDSSTSDCGMPATLTSYTGESTRKFVIIIMMFVLVVRQEISASLKYCEGLYPPSVFSFPPPHPFTKLFWGSRLQTPLVGLTPLSRLCLHHTGQYWNAVTYSKDLRVIGILVEDLAQLDDKRRKNKTFVELFFHVTCTTHMLAALRRVCPRCTVRTCV